MGAIAALMAASYWTVAFSMTRQWQLMGVALGAAQVTPRCETHVIRIRISHIVHTIGDRPYLIHLMICPPRIIDQV